ncbi:MAG TPA: IS630 family transposase [Pseudonocardia sp.]
MPNRVHVLAVSDSERAELERRLRDRGALARDVARARIVLLSSQGLTGPEIAERVGCTEPTVVLWRGRFAKEGLAGLAERPRKPPPRTTVTDEVRDEILTATLTRPPSALGITHWSSRTLAEWLRRCGTQVSHDSISRLWRRFGIQPWRVETFKFSTDPQLEAKIRDVVGLYLYPPDKAVVLSIDEKSQVQALERTAPILPLRPGLPERATHDYIRHGITTLFAALEVATGKVTDACMPRHRHQEFLRFLKQVAKAYPRVALHIVADNYATPKHPVVNKWLARNPRITMHFTPTSSSWMNMVEIFFGIITRQAIRRGSFGSLRELTDTIGRFIDAWNEDCEPFIWTKDADSILAKARRSPKTQDGALTRH